MLCDAGFVRRFLYEGLDHTIAAEAGDDVHVRVHDVLAAVYAIVHFDIQAVSFGRFFHCDRECAHEIRHRGPLSHCCLKDILRVPLRDDQCVAGICGVNVKKGERILVLSDLEARNLAAYYFAENAIIHRDAV